MHMQGTAAEDEHDVAQIQALLASEGIAESAPPPAPASKYADAIANASVCVRRDCLVLDAALGGRDAWDTELSRSEVDFAEPEERPDVVGGSGTTWTASVSVVFSLMALHPDAAPEHMHDETGSGQSQKQPSRSAAIELAEARAIESARRRLAKRFALNLDNSLLLAIEAQVGKGFVAQMTTVPKKRKWELSFGYGVGRRR